MLCDRHTSHFNNDGQRIQFNTVTRITRLGTRSTEMEEGRKQPNHERCWRQACLVQWRLSPTQMWMAGRRGRGRKRDGGKEGGGTSRETIIQYNVKVRPSRKPKTMSPRYQHIPSKPGRSHLDLGSRISIGCAVCLSLCSVHPCWDFQHHGCRFLNWLLGNTPKCCFSMLVALGYRNPLPPSCLRPAPPVLTHKCNRSLHSS